MRIVPCITISACNCTPANLQISSAQPQSAAQPSPGETGEQLCGAQRGEELDTVSQGQEGGGTSGEVVRWVTRDQASDAGGDREDIAGIPHSATGE